MTTHDNSYELPPLPPGYKSYEFPDGGYDEDDMRTYARSAIEADRKTTKKQLNAYRSLVNSLEARLAHLQAQHDELKKSTNSDLLASERAANAILTEELEAIRQRNQADPSTLTNLHTLTLDRMRELAMRDCREYSSDDLAIAWELFDRLVEGGRIIEADHYPTDTQQKLIEVLEYLQNETMKLEAAYGNNFRKEATEKARAATEKMKKAVYAINKNVRKRRGEPVYQVNMKGNGWEDCSLGRYEAAGRVMEQDAQKGWKRWERRVLWTNPQPDEPVKGALRDFLDAAKEAGIDSLDLAHIYDEPVRVPSDDDLLALIREHAFRQYEFDELLAFARDLLYRYGQQSGLVNPNSTAPKSGVHPPEIQAAWHSGWEAARDATPASQEALQSG